MKANNKHNRQIDESRLVNQIFVAIKSLIFIEFFPVLRQNIRSTSESNRSLLAKSTLIAANRKRNYKTLE